MFGPEFFPTPRRVIDKMLAKVSKDAVYFLEPSAGRGDIARAIVKRGDSYHSHNRFKVDCIELHPELCAILAKRELAVVGSDWLTYDGVSYYDAIVMNPPFSNGATHLLRAWDFLYAGEIVCLLNAETIDNPYTEERKRLAALIEAHGQVERLGQCFTDAEHATDVSVVMVYLKKVASDDDRVELWSTTTDERPVANLLEDTNLPATRDVLENKQRFYDEANRHMLLAFQHARKAATYLGANAISLHGEYDAIWSGALRTGAGHSRAEFLRQHRKDAWLSVFEMLEFHRWLDKKQTEELIRDVSQNAHFPFTVENIKGTLANVMLQRRKLFEQSAWNVFEALTKHFKGNTNHTEGWKSNDGFKVNAKLVFPYGVRYEKQFGFSLFYHSSSIDIYNDLNRVLAVLDGQSFDEVRRIGTAMENAISMDRMEPQPIESTYFEVRYYKKGTVHLKWKRYDLLEKFNVTAANGRRWLRPEEDHAPDAAPEPSTTTPEPTTTALAIATPVTPVETTTRDAVLAHFR